MDFKGYKMGKLLITTTIQATHAPLVDTCSSRDQAGNQYKGLAILLKPWARNEFGESLSQRALVLAWQRKLN